MSARDSLSAINAEVVKAGIAGILDHFDGLTAERDRAVAMHAHAQEELRALAAERDALLKFKAYVHQRLDDAGVPTDPESPHKAAGCRIGGRLDALLGERDALAIRVGVMGAELTFERGRSDALAKDAARWRAFMAELTYYREPLVNAATGESVATQALFHISWRGPNRALLQTAVDDTAIAATKEESRG